MKFTKEGWFEYLRETEFPHIQGEELEIIRRIFFLGYVTKESEIEVIKSNKLVLGVLE